MLLRLKPFRFPPPFLPSLQRWSFPPLISCGSLRDFLLDAALVFPSLDCGHPGATQSGREVYVCYPYLIIPSPVCLHGYSNRPLSRCYHLRVQLFSHQRHKPPRPRCRDVSPVFSDRFGRISFVSIDPLVLLSRAMECLLHTPNNHPLKQVIYAPCCFIQARTIPGPNPQCVFTHATRLRKWALGSPPIHQVVAHHLSPLRAFLLLALSFLTHTSVCRMFRRSHRVAYLSFPLWPFH